MTALPGSVEAWAMCMKINKRGLFCWLEGGAHDPNFTLRIEWVPPVGLGGQPLRNVSGTLARGNGAPVKIDGLSNTLLEGQFNILISRTGENAVRGTIDGQVGNGSYAVSFFAPYSVPPVTLVPDPYYIALHPESLIKQENIHGGLSWGHPYFQSTAWVGNVNYTGNCLGEHSPDNGIGSAEFAIPVGARYFSSIVGFARQDITNGVGDAIVSVYIDGQQEWSAHLVGNTHTGEVVTQTPSIGIPIGARVLRLDSDSNGRYWNDHVTWCEPAFKSAP